MRKTPELDLQEQVCAFLRVATIPPAMAGETVSLFNSSQFDSYPHPFLHGWEVRIGMSTPHET